MDILQNPSCKKHMIQKVYVDDIDYLAKQLFAFITIYRQHFYLKSDEDVEILNRLEYYARLLYYHQFDALIQNANEIIDYNDSLPF